MKMNIDKEQYLINEKKSARKVLIFYVHLAGYIVSMALLIYNLYIVEGYYKNEIISLNLSIIVAWTAFIVIHGLNIFKGRKIFKKSWEDKKIEGYLKDDENVKTTYWE